MIYNEIFGDLFNIDSKYWLCHCISTDFALGKGIAVEFNKRFDMKRKLFANYPVNGPYPACYRVDNIFNLVTKEKYWNKPTYLTLKGSLELMRNQIVKLGVQYLAMPIIGCDLDRLEWSKVSQIVKDVFVDVAIDILVVKLEK